MEAQIRPYTAQDWTAICRVHDQARPDELCGSCDPRAFVPLADTAEKEGLFRCRIWVACLQEEVIGFVATDRAYVAWLYVSPTYYRKGIGRQLFQHAVAECGSEIYVETLAQNKPALRLYESEGFQVVKRGRNQIEGYDVEWVKLVPRRGNAA